MIIARTRPATPKKMTWLVLGLAAAGVAALSVHVAMLSAGVPFPMAAPPIWARWLNGASTVVAMLAILNLARPLLARWSFGLRLLVTFVVLVTIKETFRGAIMAAMVTSAWTFSLISMLPVALISLLMLALLCTIATRWARSAATMALAGLVISAVYIAMQPLIGQAFAPVIEHFAALSHDDLYTFPYPPIVMIPAYLTFAEAVLGAAIVAALVWDRLPGGVFRRAAILALLVALVKGVVVAAFLFAVVAGGPIGMTILSYSQFLLEFLVLGFLVGLVWEKFGFDPAAAEPERAR